MVGSIGDNLPPYPSHPPAAAKPPRWGRFIAWTCAAAVAAFAIAGGVARLMNDHGGGSGGPIASPAACKAAMAVNYRRAMADPSAPSASEPTACVGLDAKTLERLMGEVVDEYLKSDQAKRDFGRLLESPTP